MTRPPDISLSNLLRLDDGERREWLRGWMQRMNLLTAHQAAPVLCLSRSTVERMVYEQAQRSRVTDQTLKIAWLIEKYGFEDSA
ncbi:hypothetical protein [Azospirillum sp. sgz302134]